MKNYIKPTLLIISILLTISPYLYAKDHVLTNVNKGNNIDSNKLPNKIDLSKYNAGLFQASGGHTAINSLMTADYGLPLADYSPPSNGSSMNIGMTEIKLNDGLIYKSRINPEFMANGAPSLVPAAAMLSVPFSFNDGAGGGAVLFPTKSNPSLFISSNGYYAMISVSRGMLYHGSVYSPTGEHYYFNAKYLPPYWAMPSDSYSIKSKHNKDIITYKFSATGSWTQYDGVYSLTLTNGYIFNSTNTCDNHGACNIHLSNNIGDTWSGTNGHSFVSEITMPTGYVYSRDDHEDPSIPIIYSSPRGLKVNASHTGISILGSDIEGYKISIESTFRLDPSTNINPYYTQLTYPDGDSVVYSYGPATDKGGEIPANTIGLLTSKVIKNKSGTVIYSEKNTYTAINGVQALTEKDVTQDGVTSKTIYSDFNLYNKPQKIVKTSSNGKTLTTNIVYNITGAPSVDGAIFLIQPKTITKINGDDKTLYSETNTYDADGFLMSKKINGVLTTYSYDKMGNIQTKTDASGNVWTYNNYMSGYPQEVIDPDGNKTEYVYDSRGLILSKTDSKGNKTTYDYDPKSWKIIKETPPTGNPITYTYSNYFKTVVETQGTNVKTTNYDSLGRIMNVTDEDTKTGKKYIVVHKYDLNDNKEFTSYPCSDITKCTLGTIKQVDILGRTVNLTQNTTWTAGA